MLTPAKKKICREKLFSYYFFYPAPSGAPQNVRAITKSSLSIILYWMPPKADEQNGEITSYNIKLNSNDLTQARNVSTTTNATTLPITGLQAYTNYSFMVQAVNEGGIGPYSSLVANRTFEAGNQYVQCSYYPFKYYPFNPQ